MKKKNMEIIEFNNCVYPISLYIVTDPEMGEIADKFYQMTQGGELTEFEIKNQRTPIASIADCYHKLDKQSGVMCLIWKKREMKKDIMAHEASHIASLMFEKLGIEIDGFYGSSNEPFAYLIGWVVRCIDGVINTKKPKAVVDGDKL